MKVFITQYRLKLSYALKLQTACRKLTATVFPFDHRVCQRFLVIWLVPETENGENVCWSFTKREARNEVLWRIEVFTWLKPTAFYECSGSNKALSSDLRKNHTSIMDFRPGIHNNLLRLRGKRLTLQFCFGCQVVSCIYLLSWFGCQLLLWP